MHVFYVVVWGGYMRSYGADTHVEESKGIKDCRAAREIDSKLGS